MALSYQQRSLAQAELKTVKVLGPEPVVRQQEKPAVDGIMRVLGARKGMNISAFDWTYEHQVDQLQHTMPCIAFSILFEAKGATWLLDQEDQSVSKIAMKPGQFYCMYAPDGAVGRETFPAGSRLRGLDIRLDPALWEKLGGTEIVKQLSENHIFHVASHEKTWCGILPFSPSIRQLAKDLQLAVEGGDDDILAEARSLELIAEANRLLQSRRISAPLYQREKRIVEQAQQVILADLARTWTVDLLAKEMGVSSKFLQNAFPKHIELPVYQYIQEVRLTHAHQLLCGSNASVTDIALQVGYSSLSHFSALFKRRFGMSPSTVNRPSIV